MTLLMREREKYKEGKADGLKEGEKNGKAFGIIEFTKGLGYADKDIIATLQKTLSINIEQSEDYLKQRR